MHNVQQLKSESLKLNESERAELALALIESLHRKPDSEAQAIWDKEIERRVEEIKSGKVKGRPVDDVFAEVRAKYQ